jgi:exportin-7
VPQALEAGVLDELLEGEEALAEQLEALPYLCRFQYESVASYVCSLMDPLAERFRAAARLPAPPATLAVVEGQLSWLVYIIGAVVRGRLTSSSAETQARAGRCCPPRMPFFLLPSWGGGAHARCAGSWHSPRRLLTRCRARNPTPCVRGQELTDGELSARVFGLARAADEGLHGQRYGELTRQRLDTSILSFFQSFRKVYIGEQVMHASKVRRPATRSDAERYGAMRSDAALQPPSAT